MPILETMQREYRLLRTFGAEDAATLAACLDLTAAGDFANKSATAFALPQERENSPANAVEILFAGTDAANETFSYGIYAYADENGPAELICTGTGTLGTQAVVKYPDTAATATNTFWADTLTATGYHIKTVTVADGSAANRVAKLTFDATGYRYLKVYVYDAGGGAECSTVGAYIRWF